VGAEKKDYTTNSHFKALNRTQKRQLMNRAPRIDKLAKTGMIHTGNTMPSLNSITAIQKQIRRH